MPAAPGKSYVVTVKTRFPAGTIVLAVPSAAASGEQFGDDGVRFTITGGIPSVRIFSDCVLAETYFGVTRAAVALGRNLMVSATLPCAMVGWRLSSRAGARGLEALDNVGAVPPQPVKQHERKRARNTRGATYR